VEKLTSKERLLLTEGKGRRARGGLAKAAVRSETGRSA